MNMPRRKNNESYRGREHLFLHEIKSLIYLAETGGKTSAKDKNRIRDQLIILLLFHHGLRTEELCLLRWDAIDWTNNEIFINRVKGSISNTHPFVSWAGDELGLLNQWYKQCATTRCPFLFPNKDNDRLQPKAISRLVERLSKQLTDTGELQIKVHAHMLRHSCGYHTTNMLNWNLRDVQEWLGHKEVSNTVRYSHLSANRFKKLPGVNL